MAMSMPVGGRNSPNTARSASPHSPVVTPASAQRIELGMMFSPLLRRVGERAQRRLHLGVVAALSVRLQALDLLAFGRRVGLHDAPSLPTVSGDAAVSWKQLTPMIFRSPDSIARSRFMWLPTSSRLM